MELIHTCYRIGDIDRSVAFYVALGFEERRRMQIRDEATKSSDLPGTARRADDNFGVDSYEIGAGWSHRRVGGRHCGDARAAAGAGIEPERVPYRVREGGS
jgi:lactoylglutathione lyase